MEIFLGIVCVIALIAWLGFIVFICYKDHRKLQIERQAKIDMYNLISGSILRGVVELGCIHVLLEDISNNLSK